MSHWSDLHPDTAAAIEEIRRDKYMLPGDNNSWDEALIRVAIATTDFEGPLYGLLKTRRAQPAGRVLAGAGSGHNVTLANCFVSPLLQDSMRTEPDEEGLGIWDCLAHVAYSMQMGGGVGTDFSPLRPRGALVSKLNAPASGPLPYMDTWDSMCRTIMSAGYRRGAMMATLAVDHPAIFEFIRAKRVGERLRMFNLSVLVTDEFMRAKEADDSWELGHWAPPFDRSKPVSVTERYDPRKKVVRPWFVYEIVRARAIWDEIMRSNYEHAEPGVIFIDHVNRTNNLHYCEHISCTNPCAEQPLAPDNNCNLSHVNVARCVVGIPFDHCAINFDAIVDTARLLTRMSNRVVDLLNPPTDRQQHEAQAKRRLGIGLTGLANALAFTRTRYGSAEGVLLSGTIMREIRDACYRESIEIAKVDGPFPAFDRDQYLAGEYAKTLPEDIRQSIYEHGVRNSHLNTIAPTGTTSLAQGDNCSSGLEPVFAHRVKRNVLQPDGSYKISVMEDFGFRVYANVLFGGDGDAAASAPMPTYMVTVDDLTPREHLETMAELQRYNDSSISKTINVPADIAFESFVGIYDDAYSLGCKSCTTYRPNEASGRGAVLTAAGAPELPAASVVPAGALSALRARPDVLDGRTYRLRWAALGYPMFLTVNDEILPDGTRIPYEVFVNSKAADSAHWITALTRMISATMRKGGDLSFIPAELKAVYSAKGGEWVGQRYVPSEVALIGSTLERHFQDIGYVTTVEPTSEEVVLPGFAELGAECPQCGSPSVVRQEGCNVCLSCKWSKCG